MIDFLFSMRLFNILPPSQRIYYIYAIEGRDTIPTSQYSQTNKINVGFLSQDKKFTL